MSAAKLKLTIDQGSTYRKTITWKTGPITLLVPVDLSLCTARMQIRSEVAASDFLYELTTENGGITLGGTTGTIDLYISDSDTSSFDWVVGVYDLEIEFTNLDVRRILSGQVIVSPEVTR